MRQNGAAVVPGVPGPWLTASPCARLGEMCVCVSPHPAREVGTWGQFQPSLLLLLSTFPFQHWEEVEGAQLSPGTEQCWGAHMGSGLTSVSQHLR